MGVVNIISNRLNLVLIILGTFLFTSISAQVNDIPLRVAVDLNVGEKKNVVLSNGEKIEIVLTGIEHSVDNLRSAVRSAQVELLVNNKEVVLEAANYNLPVIVGNVQIDCPVTKAWIGNRKRTNWELLKEARLRIWPKDAPFIQPGTYVYPIKQRLLANDTQMNNDPCYVNAGEEPGNTRIYYHSGLDFGGSEGRDEVVSPVDGIVMLAGMDILPEYGEFEYAGSKRKPQYDVVTVRDNRGWYHALVHLFGIDSEIHAGSKVKMGQKIGTLGKEGTAGGWTHLHYSIWSMQPSGKIGEENGYPYIWQAYNEQYKPDLVAVARPHKFVAIGEKVSLDGSKSIGFSGRIKDYEWIFSDGTTASGIRQERVYDTPGTYSEVLKITDENGNIDFDYTVVLVIDPDQPEKLPPTIHATYFPSMGIHPGYPVIFGVRTFLSDVGQELWDFGDGTEKVITQSKVYDNKRKGLYAEVSHKYEKPGHYLVKVERSNEYGFNAISHLQVVVE